LSLRDEFKRFFGGRRFDVKTLELGAVRFDESVPSFKRFERVNLLQKRGDWKEGDRGLGLKKTKPEA